VRNRTTIARPSGASANNAIIMKIFTALLKTDT
jgi:hypothetical protein